MCGLNFQKRETVESTLSINLGELLITPLQKKIPQFSVKFHGLIKNSPDILWDLIFEEQKTFLVDEVIGMIATENKKYLG